MRPAPLRLLSLLAGTALVSGICQAGGPDQTDYDRLLQRVNNLQAEVTELRGRLGEDALTEERAEQIRLLVHDVLADADTRASLLQSAATSGYDGGFFIRSGDGSFELKINALLQTRFVFNTQDDSPGDDTRWGFELPHTKVIFSGHVIDATWVYRIEAQYLRSGGQLQLGDAYIGKAFGDSGWTGLAGQFKVPMLRETLVYSQNQQLVERSLVGQEFSAGRTQGVAADWRNDMFHVVAGWTNGHPATSGGANTPWSMYDTEIALTGRVEWLASGSWAQFNDFQGWPDEETGVMVGAALHYEKGEYGTTAEETDVTQWTIDASAEFGGASVFGYVVGRHIASGADQYGLVIQGGYFITEDWELFGRYEWGDDDSGGDDLSVLTIGANRYFHRNGLKWSTDIGFGFNQVTSTWANGSLGEGGDITGWREDSPGQDGQVVIRTQLQLYF